MSISMSIQMSESQMKRLIESFETNFERKSKKKLFGIVKVLRVFRAFSKSESVEQCVPLIEVNRPSVLHPACHCAHEHKRISLDAIIHGVNRVSRPCVCVESTLLNPYC